MPRLWCPGASRRSIAASAAASMTLIITGVASTGMRPLPTRAVVCSGPTTTSAVPLAPTVTRDRSTFRPSMRRHFDRRRAVGVERFDGLEAPGLAFGALGLGPDDRLPVGGEHEPRARVGDLH